ncbi:MAG: FecR domain-containing protein [Phycisphaerae bacterium]
MRHTIILLVVLMLAVSTPAQESSENEAPAEAGTQPTDSANAGGIAATVVSVSGRAQKLATDSDWKDLVAGDELGGNTVIRTGLGSEVVLELAGYGEVTIDRATKMGIGELSKEGDSARAHMGLKYGRLRAEVETTAGPTDMRIQTAAATLSIRGSGAKVAHMGTQTRASSYQGSWGLSSPSGFTVLSSGQGGGNAMTPWQTTNTKGTQPGLLGQLHGLSGSEKNHLLFNGSGRSLPGFLGPFGQPTGLMDIDGRREELRDYHDQQYIPNGVIEPGYEVGW